MHNLCQDVTRGGPMIQGSLSSIERLVKKFGAKPRSLETQGHRVAKETQGPRDSDSRFREKSRASVTPGQNCRTNHSRVPHSRKKSSHATVRQARCRSPDGWSARLALEIMSQVSVLLHEAIISNPVNCTHY